MNDEPSIVRELKTYEKNDKASSYESIEVDENVKYEDSIPFDIDREADLQFYKMLVENLIEGILVLDFKGRVLYANPAIVHIFGFQSIEDTIGRNALDFIDSKYRKRVIKDQLLVRCGRGGFLNIYQATRNDGQSIWIEGLGYKMKYEGKTANVVFIRDITHRQETWGNLINLEKKYRAIAEMSADGIILLDPLGRLSYTNPSFQKMVGRSVEQLNDSVFRHYLSDDSIYLFQQHFIESRRTDKKIEHIELELIDSNGENIPIELSMSPLRRDETFTGFVCTVHDIIERKQMEEEIKKSERLKTEFMNIAAHELKSPVTPIKGYLDLIISDAETNQKTKKWAQVSLRNSERLLLLVNDILDVSRLDSDTMKFDMKRVSPNEFLDEIAEDLKPVVEKKNLEFQKDIPPGLPPILCDMHRLMQVIRNLIINSVKFTDKGFIRLSATIEDSWLHICVEDTGIGIRRDELPSIFHKFYQADSGERRQHEGTGLGLFICKEIVKKHHGDITVRSALGKGSMFCVKLPVLVK